MRWAAHNVRFHRTGVKRVHQPVVGDLVFGYEAMELSADAGLTLSVFTAEPGSASQQALTSSRAGRRARRTTPRHRVSDHPATVTRSQFQQRADELAAARSRCEIDDDAWFSGMAAIFNAAYPAGDNPRAQSGFGGDEARWEAARSPVAELIDRDGTFLDVGCANGYLMECVVRWARHRVEPYGLELAGEVAELARQQRPQWADRIFLGNALTWQPPMRFDFVRVELLYAPEGRQGDLLQRLMGEVVAPGGRLIVCGYGSPRSGVSPHPVRRLVRRHGYAPEIEFERQAPEGGGAIIEVAVLRQ